MSLWEKLFGKGKASVKKSPTRHKNELINSKKSVVPQRFTNVGALIQTMQYTEKEDILILAYRGKNDQD